jgi:hypothetical protein
MATIEITAGPSGPGPAAQMASAAAGGGRTAAPAESGDARFAVNFEDAGKNCEAASGFRSRSAPPPSVPA